MEKGLDIEFVKQNYKRMPDDELIRIATQDAAGMIPEAMEVVRTEIIKRGWDQNIAKGIEAQNKEYSAQEIDNYCDIISKLNCPYCNSRLKNLNATIAATVMSFIIFTNYEKKLKVGCPECLDKANNNALILSGLLGWWGIPWGIIRTPQAIGINFANKRTNHVGYHNKYLRKFILSAIGEIETYKDDKTQLQRILTRKNEL